MQAGGLGFSPIVACLIESSVSGSLNDMLALGSVDIPRIPLALPRCTMFGAMEQMIEPVGERLSIPKANIFANRIIFDDVTGEYKGFDKDEPTSRDGGKPKVLRM